ncbi:RTA1 domain-containing protein [Ascoidea rubescens DSM 1968]|uniref:Sphingoid long-chain base transporter RSB1 n=1 Tax=Ascoidea rubescens DSM 1968 TaxID=1344418 RepID=A0A1D2VI04_9ASCO|nr:RTA1-domain-containing protein [Ascoidea rubescens DSM 1968]ODV61107.1 RTA1-domain-containing protein [Ascoidea rubescens DSM 1968]
MSATISLLPSMVSGTALPSETIEYSHGMIPSFGGNLSFAIVMGILFITHAVFGVFYKQFYFGIAFFIGCLLEVIGYIARTLSNNDPTNDDLFLIQIVTLTIAPAFIMAGNYYLLAKLVAVYGNFYSFLKPIAYSYIFVFCDLISLVLQGLGGGISASSLSSEDNESADLGNDIMLAGLIFQVISMSVFLVFWLDFVYSIYFKTNKISRKFNEMYNNDNIDTIDDDSNIHLNTNQNNNQHNNKNNYSKLSSIKPSHPFDLLSKDHLFNPDYKQLRQNNKLLQFFPIIVTLSVLFIYVRCFYRVFELAEGWRGELILNEIYIFILDALMMSLGIVVLAYPFYPGHVLRSRRYSIEIGARLKLSDLKLTKKDLDQHLYQIKLNQDKNRFDESDDQSKSENFNLTTFADDNRVSSNLNNGSPRSQTAFA